MGRRILAVGLPVVLVASIAGAAWMLTALEHQEGAPGDPSDKKQVAFGRVLYAANCARCHGQDLGGEFSWAQFEGGLSDEDIKIVTKRLDDVAPAHDARGSTSRLSDNTLFRVIEDGPKDVLNKPQSRMSGFGDELAQGEIWAIIAFMKSHWSEADVEMKDG